MKLTPEQIEQLYTFTRKHYVEYYDLQTELVDHLANAIEEQWAANPKISFEDALEKEFKKFGVCGFLDVVEQRKSALRKKYEKIAWGYIKEFFKLPLIILTISLLAFFTLCVDENQRVIITVILLAIFLGLNIYYWFVRRIKKYGKENEDKKWLFEDVLRKHKPITYFYYFFLISFYSHHFKDRISFNVPIFIQSLYDSVFILYLALYIYIMRIVIPKKTKEYLKQTYPEYELAG